MKYIVGGIAMAIAIFIMNGTGIDRFTQGVLSTNAYWFVSEVYGVIFKTTTKLRR